MWLDIRTRDLSKGKLKELPVPLHIGADDLLKILKLPDFDTLHYEVHYLSRYIYEEYLFKVGLSTQAGRSHVQMLKKSAKVSEAVPQPSKVPSKRPGSEGDLWSSILISSLNDWNNEFVKVKYLRGEYKKKYDGKVKEMKAVEEQLVECRAELTNIMTSSSLHNQQMDRLHIDLVDA
ncbi:hypothetical protein IEQ34_020916 [Dendrobium chrysotoxum]|uniref:Uncharacterized protein n=1 Tax=Dendrobium chrysotoxum TaxID=161865 RepID=A0AAV7FKV4_DENCH|nr:hypothetical protein IEQ34_020916 [Dendrobium chrysotoxum]